MKKNTNIYSNVKFNSEPYSTNEKFCVYIPYNEDELIHNQQEHRAPRQRDQLPPRQVQIEDEEYVPTPQKPQTPEQHHRVNFQEKTRSLNKSSKPYSSQSNQFRIAKSSNELSKSLQQFMKDKQIKNLREKLYFDDRTKTVPKSNIKNHIIEDIVKDGDLFIQNKRLMDQIYKLKQLNLLKSHDISQQNIEQAQKGHGKVPFVYNDFHTKSTNNGYSRNFGGVFYTR